MTATGSRSARSARGRASRVDATTSDFGPCVVRGADGRLEYRGAPEIILENRPDLDRPVDRHGNRPVVRGARRSTTLGEMLGRGVINKSMHDAGSRFLDALSVAGGSTASSLAEALKVAPGSRTGVSDRQLDAIREVRRVMVHLGLNSDTVMWWVVVGNRSTAEFDRTFRLREGTGADWLRASLAQLDAMYYQ